MIQKQWFSHILEDNKKCGKSLQDIEKEGGGKKLEALHSLLTSRK
jgi:hypothetical protein